MTPVSQWSFTIKSASIIGALGFVTLLASVVGALSVLEPYLPAHRKFVRTVAEEARTADAAQYRALDAALNELKLIAFDGQIREAKLALSETMERLAESPGDQFLIDLRDTREKELERLEALRKAVQCEIWSVLCR